MDEQKIAREMRILAEERISQIVGQEEILLTKSRRRQGLQQIDGLDRRHGPRRPVADHQNRPEGLDSAADRRRNAREWIVRPSAPRGRSTASVFAGAEQPREYRSLPSRARANGLL